MKYEKVAEVGELKSGEKKKVSLVNKEVLLVNIQGTFYAVDNKCPHMGGSLYNGNLDGTHIVCPNHGSIFDVTTGNVVQGGKMLFINVKVKNLHTHPLKIEGNDVLIEME